MSERIRSTPPHDRLGDSHSVRDQLRIVTGCRAHWSSRGHDFSSLGENAGRPASPGPTLTMERTPLVIRALKDEGIIGTC